MQSRQALSDGDIIQVGDVAVTINIGENQEDPLPGQVLAGVEIESMLGAGSFGQVYTGYQRSLDRRVAVKVLDPGIAVDDAKRSAFIAEAQQCARLSHPHLVQVFDICSENGYHFIVMELLAGGNMGDYLKRHGPIDNEDTARILYEMGEALGYAEAQRFVHRDVKPDNILISSNGIHKLADLGIATSINNDGQAIQDRPFGSAHYCAPEQAAGRAIDARADIYGLGASVYHLVTGKTLFTGSSAELVRQHLTAKVPSLQKNVPNLDPELALLIHAMLEKTQTIDRQRHVSLRQLLEIF